MRGEGADAQLLSEGLTKNLVGRLDETHHCTNGENDKTKGKKKGDEGILK